MNDALLRLVLIVIAAVTVLSGLAQLFFPGMILNGIGGALAAPSPHLFATVGMFMVITGAMFMQSLLRRSAETLIPFWIGVQKALAALLVSIAIVQGFFSPIALVVAGFDGATAILTFIFWARMSR
jgi:hypothetical protein